MGFSPLRATHHAARITPCPRDNPNKKPAVGPPVSNCPQFPLLLLGLGLTVIPPLQRRAIVVAAAVRAATGLVAGGSAPQTGLAPILLLDNLVPVLNGSQPRFYVVKFRG